MTEESEQVKEKPPLSRKVKVVALSMGQGLARVIGLMTMMVMARVLTKEDLAAYNQTLLAYAFVAPFIGLGISQGIFYFLPTEKFRIRGRVLGAITIQAAMGLFFALFLAFGGNQLLAARFDNPKVAEMLLWLIPYAMVTPPAQQCVAVLVVRDQVMRSSVFQVTRQFFIGIATILPVLIWQTAEAPLIGNVVASVLFGFEAIRLMIKATPNDSQTPTREGIQEILKFSLPLGLATMAGTISMQMDKMIVGFMFSPEEFAVYSLGAIEIPLLAVLTGSITSIMLPEIRKAVAENNKAEALRLFKMAANKTSLVIFPAMIFLFVCSTPFILMLYGDAYADSVYPFQVYLLKLPYRVVVFGSLLMALGQNLFILKRSIWGLVMGGGVSYMLVQYIGPIGAAVGGVLVAYIYAVPANFRALSRGLGVPWFETLNFPVLARTFLMSLPVGVLGWLSVFVLKEYHPVIQLTAAGVVVGPYCLWWWHGKLYDLVSLRERFFNGS